MAAIFMWREGQKIVITTTPYPVEATDSMETSFTFKQGSLDLIPGSELESTHDAQDGYYTQVRWFYEDGPYDSDLTSTHDAQDGVYVQVRWFYYDGPYDSYLQSTHSIHDGTLANKLVVADTPDEKLQLGLAINTNCSMDLV